MTTFLSTVVLFLSATGGFGGGVMGGSGGMIYDGSDGPAVIQGAGVGDDTEALLLGLQEAARGGNPQDRLLRTVFVVPGPDLAAEGIAQISEDLAVMCRIFDKAAVWAKGPGTVPVDVSGVEISPYLILTQALYLDGYGAIFFLPVDFPLAASQQEEEPKAEPSSDPLWSQTAGELRGVPPQSARPSSLQYNERKVENLKAALIGTLRHAANLRTRRAEDAVAIVIATRLNQTDRRGWVFGPSAAARYGEPFAQQQVVVPAIASPDLPTVLILRAIKADVDALAKGSLSQEQFAGKVQILKSWTNPSPAASSGGARSILSAPSSQNR
jgi:hypothetical protein